MENRGNGNEAGKILWPTKVKKKINNKNQKHQARANLQGDKTLSVCHRGVVSVVQEVVRYCNHRHARILPTRAPKQEAIQQPQAANTRALSRSIWTDKPETVQVSVNTQYVGEKLGHWVKVTDSWEMNSSALSLRRRSYKVCFDSQESGKQADWTTSTTAVKMEVLCSSRYSLELWPHI